MKRLFLIFTIFITLFSISSCKSDKVENKSVSTKKTVSKNDEDLDEVMDVNEVSFIDEVDEDEFLRSTNDLSSEETVTKQEFSDDKAQILQIISELSVIMEQQDVNAWLKYIDPESIKYYSSPANIKKAQKKLPDKTIELHGIGDYFKYVFIPSRKRSEVDEIRYISKTSIKAVKVKSDNSINVYYYFVKVDGKWLVHIPTL